MTPKPTNIEEQMKQRILFYEDLSIRFGNGSGDSQAYCSIQDIAIFVTQHTQSLLERLEKQAVEYDLVTHDFGTAQVVGNAKAVPLEAIKQELRNYE